MENHVNKNRIFAVSSDLATTTGMRGTVEHGRAHYSYRSVRDKFCQMFDDAAEPWVELSHPEIYREFNAHHSLLAKAKADSVVHISFKPPEHLRVAGGYFNVAHIAWEFERLPSKYATLPVLPNNDYARMLTTFDQVWVGCEFTRMVLEENGLKNVFTIPAPISTTPFILSDARSYYASLMKVQRLSIECFPIAIRNHRFQYADRKGEHDSIDVSRLIENTREHGGKMFLQILNPHDRRKNVVKLIRAFHAHKHDHPHDTLLLKFTSPEKDRDVYSMFTWLLGESHALDAEGVYFTTRFIPEAQKYDFLKLFDFYLSPSRAEGQNLPLMEAMMAGLVPVTTVNTAMLDYVEPANSFVIDGKNEEITHLTNPDSKIWGMHWQEISEVSLLRALAQAAQASPDKLQKMRIAGRKQIEQKYSYETVMKNIQSVLTV